MNGVFISYRQDDTKPWALLLQGELASAFGEEQVFLDKDTLHAGPWREQIQLALEGCRVVLVLIGRRWLEASGPGGERRIDLPDDVHRQEIAFALSHQALTVIPVLLDGARMPASRELPDDIRSLCECQSREMSDNSARRRVDIDLLLADIERAAGLRRTARATGLRPGARLSSLLRFAAFSFAMTLAAWVLLYLYDNQPPLPDETLLIALASLAVTATARSLLSRFRKRSRHPES